jgi:hypothetical protein
MIGTAAMNGTRSVRASHASSATSRKLSEAAPKLRAKCAGTVVTALLEEDALALGSRLACMSDRGLRRLCDRLVELGAVRELTGRTTFRLYGL